MNEHTHDATCLGVRVREERRKEVHPRRDGAGAGQRVVVGRLEQGGAELGLGFGRGLGGWERGVGCVDGIYI